VVAVEVEHPQAYLGMLSEVEAEALVHLMRVITQAARARLAL
jgi:hypothetical protein